MQRPTPREISTGQDAQAGNQPADKPTTRRAAPPARKFYEPFVKPARRKPEPREEREERDRPPRSPWLQSSESQQRIPSSASTRSYGRGGQRRENDPWSEEYRGGPRGPRRDFRNDDRPGYGPSSGPGYPRDDRRPRPFPREGGEASRRPYRQDSRSDYRPDYRRDDREGYRPEYRSDYRADAQSRYPRDARQPRPFRPADDDWDREAASRPQRPRSSYGRPFDDRERSAYASRRAAPHLTKRILRADEPRPERTPSQPSVRPEEMQLASARRVAAQVLLRRLHGQAFTEELLEEAFAQTRMRPDNRRLAQEMVYGCVRWQATLDWLVARRTEDRPQLAPTQVFLRLGLYQLFFLDRIPPHAACYETVELAKQLGCANQADFINAILRRSEADREAIEKELEELEDAQPAIGYSHPNWLLEKWVTRWDVEDTRKLLEWNNTPPSTHARVNLLKTTPAKLIERWRLRETVEYDLTPCSWAEDGHVLTLKSQPSLAALGSFRDGWFYVQDPSTLLAVQALDAWAGESILDLCAAPGGKTAYIAQKMENDGEILACDTGADRLKRVTENCTRLGVTCVKTLPLGDHPEQALFGKQFDKALVDAPCSNTGVMRRRVDLRWRLRPEEISRLRETQLKLLALAAAHLKPGGTLVYSTCSLEPEENSEVVKDFLAAHPAFQLESERELLPFRDNVDGAYVAKLRRAP